MKFPTALKEKKKLNQKITMLTAYDAPTAAMLAEVDIDIILVGDSLGNVIAGFKNTLPVTTEMMFLHTQYVSRGAPNALIIADLPFLSYTTPLDGLQVAGRFIKETQAKGIKLETNPHDLDTVHLLTTHGIPVMGHVGLRPQQINQLGGYKKQAKTDKDAQALLTFCQELERAGAFAIVLELIPEEVAKEISQALTIPTLGIGAGPHCDGQVLVTSDLLGLTPQTPPKFVTQYAKLHTEIKKSLLEFKHDVENQSFKGG